MNGSIQEINEIDPKQATPLVKGAGMSHLTGRQAVGYMRIRKVGTDTQRIQRQQNVISKLFSQAKKMGIGQLPGLISALSSCVRTDIKPADKMLDIATTIIGLDTKEIKTFRYPDEFEYGSYKSMDIVQPKDFDSEIKKLQEFLNK
jgi:anionic cell wall polymer biosynthesis LytR-Cps2A-Psr (LCP) family protein